MQKQTLIPLLMICPLQEDYVRQLASYYEVVYAPTKELKEAVLREHGGRFRAVLTIGAIGLQASEMDAMPKLELICALGVGYEGVDISAAKARNLTVTNGAGTNDGCVADHAFGLLIAAVRGIVQLDKGVREGLWRDQMDFYTPNVSGKKLGIVGLGMIGRQIAKRALGFDLEVGYFTRNPKEDVPFQFFKSALELATWCDYLIVATPGGLETKHMINAEIIAALGPQGTLGTLLVAALWTLRHLLKHLSLGIFHLQDLMCMKANPMHRKTF